MMYLDIGVDLKGLLYSHFYLGWKYKRHSKHFNIQNITTSSKPPVGTAFLYNAWHHVFACISQQLLPVYLEA